jgi:nucleoredoxin
MAADANDSVKLTEILGAETASKIGSDVKVLGLYFSAHWCPPCRHFTPMLADSYKKNDFKGKGMEVVFISSDQNKEAAESYFKEMPWLMLPYEVKQSGSMSESLKAISKEVRGIPTLVLVDAQTGAVLSKDGRGLVSMDKTGAWIAELTGSAAPPAAETKSRKDSTASNSTADATPRQDKELNAVEKLLYGTPMITDTDKTPTELKAGDNVITALYFSAHWCPPCRRFTPELAKVYQGLKAEGYTKFEVVFVSSDADDHAFLDYFNDMPWLALPYENRELKTKLSDYFSVSGIPTLTILDKNMNTVELDTNWSTFEAKVKGTCPKK